MFRYYFFFDALRYVHERTLTYKDFPNINSIPFGSHNGILQAKKFPFLSQVVPFIFKFRHFLSFPYHINFSITYSISQTIIFAVKTNATTSTFHYYYYIISCLLTNDLFVNHDFSQSSKTVAMVTVPFTKPE